MLAKFIKNAIVNLQIISISGHTAARLCPKYRAKPYSELGAYRVNGKIN
jgi:hypothetical protein